MSNISRSPELDDMVEKLDLLALAEHKKRAQSLDDEATADAASVAMQIVATHLDDSQAAMVEWLNTAS